MSTSEQCSSMDTAESTDGNNNTAESNTFSGTQKVKQVPVEYLTSYPLPKNWSHIERLKSQRNKIQEKLLQQSFPTNFQTSKQYTSTKQKDEHNLEMCSDLCTEQETNPSSCVDEESDTDSEGHLVIDYMSSHSDIHMSSHSDIHMCTEDVSTQSDKSTSSMAGSHIQYGSPTPTQHSNTDSSDNPTTRHAYMSISADHVAGCHLSQTNNIEGSKSLGDCTSSYEDKDLCELKVSSINNSLLKAIAGSECQRAEEQLSHQNIETKVEDKSKFSLSKECKEYIVSLNSPSKVSAKECSETETETYLCNEIIHTGNENRKKLIAALRQLTKSTDGLQNSLHKLYSKQFLEKKIKSYLIANKIVPTKKVSGTDKGKTLVAKLELNHVKNKENDSSATRCEGTKTGDTDDSPHVDIVNNDSPNKNDNSENKMKEKRNNKLKLLQETNSHQEGCKDKSSGHHKKNSESGDGAANNKDNDIDATINSKMKDGPVAELELSKHHSNIEGSEEKEMAVNAKPAIHIQSDTQGDVSQMVTEPTKSDGKLSSKSVIVTSCIGDTKQANMKSLLTTSSQRTSGAEVPPRTDCNKGEFVSLSSLADRTMRTGMPMNTMMLNKPLKAKSPCFMVPVRPMAIQTSLGHPFALSPLSAQINQQARHRFPPHSVSNQPVLVMVDKMNHILPQSTSRYMVVDPATSSQPSSTLTTVMPTIISSGQIMGNPQINNNHPGLVGSHTGVYQHVPQVLQVASTPTPFIASWSQDKLLTSNWIPYITAVSRKATVTGENASMSKPQTDCAAENEDDQVQKKGEISQTVPCKQNQHVGKRKRSRHRSKASKFQEIAAWKKCDENDDIVEDTQGQIKSSEIYEVDKFVCPSVCSSPGSDVDKLRSPFSPSICPSPGSDVDKLRSPFSPSICPSSQNSVSVDSDSDYSFDSIDLDLYEKLKHTKKGCKEDNDSQNDDIVKQSCIENTCSESKTKSPVPKTNTETNSDCNTVAENQNSGIQNENDESRAEKTDAGSEQNECKMDQVQGSPMICDDVEPNPKDMDIQSRDKEDREHECESRESTIEKDMPVQMGIGYKSNLQQLNDIKDGVIPIETVEKSPKQPEGNVGQSPTSPTASRPTPVSEQPSPNPVVHADPAQKKFMRTKFIILKGDICNKWLEIKKKAGFGNVPDPCFVHYLLDVVERKQTVESQSVQNSVNNQESTDIKDKKISRKRPAEDDYGEGKVKQETKKHRRSPTATKTQQPDGTSPTPAKTSHHWNRGPGFMSKSVKKQIQWAVNVFREWLKGQCDMETDFECQSTAWLNLMLERFYKEARTMDNNMYTRTDLQNLRRCLSVYLDSYPESTSVSISIQLDPGFYTSNQVLLEIMKTRQDATADEDSYISQSDFVKMYTSGTLSDNNPVSLMWKVWFDVCFHLCNPQFPENFLKSLKKQQLSLQSDVNGVYYTFTNDICLPYDDDYGRMYATPDYPHRCPVRTTTVYLSKLCNNCDAFFQCPNSSWQDGKMFYRPIPLTSSKLNCIMQNISEKANLSRTYTISDVFSTWSKYKCIKVDDD